MDLKIILGIPGPWRSPEELGQAISASGVGYHLNANHDRLIGPGSDAELTWQEPDATLRRAYEMANRQSLSHADLDLIEHHAGCAYLVCPGGSLDAGRDAMALAAIVLRAGGFGVRVETAGVALSAWDWLAQSERSHTHVGALYISFVSLFSRSGEVHSCGMHNLGLPDAMVTAQQNTANGGELLRGFLMSVVHEQLTLRSGYSTLSDGAGGIYQLTHRDCVLYEPNDPYFNPFGIWEIAPRSNA